MEKLILTVGLPKSGKSTWAKEYSGEHNVPMVNPDSIRYALHGEKYIQSYEDEVWHIAKVMTDALFLAGHKEIIIDATNINDQARSIWESGDREIEYKNFEVSKEECIERAEEEGDYEIIPIISSMARRIDYP